ncbi:type II toxin-antitoxin system RelE/ParE family toxin, partial [Azospirillum sp. B4]|uniref:type II toxin-antitoxin system RelE/ParE family toxin n=1 Tax=Azospirillum sp. B4 TaxID=95605 RepID=UPI00131F335F
ASEPFRAARERLAVYPLMAPAGLIPGTRRLVVAPYVLTLRQRSRIVEIVDIRHARQDDGSLPSGEQD